jgi:hypothetical protein
VVLPELRSRSKELQPRIREHREDGVSGRGEAGSAGVHEKARIARETASAGKE